jgi:hypothetical protein
MANVHKVSDSELEAVFIYQIDPPLDGIFLSAWRELSEWPTVCCVAGSSLNTQFKSERHGKHSYGGGGGETRRRRQLLLAAIDLVH